MMDGHFDYGNGYHGRVYLNPHQLFRHPSTIWRFAQDLIDVMPGDLVQQTEVVAGPATGGALLAHTIAGLLDSRRSLTHPPCSFAPFHRAAGGFALRAFYRAELKGRRVLLADDAEHGRDTGPLRSARAGRRRHGRGDCRDLRSVRGDRGTGRSEHRAGGVQSAAELPQCRLPVVPVGHADYQILRTRRTRTLRSQVRAPAVGLTSQFPSAAC